MDQEICARYNNCEKMLLILSMDSEKYDADGLCGDICWLCEEYAGETTPALRHPDRVSLGAD